MPTISPSRTLVATLVAAVCLTPVAFGQTSQFHHEKFGDMPPGAIGQRQLVRGGAIAGYFQPVEIRVPAGAQISLAAEGTFQPPQAAPVKIGMLVGQVYRFKITNIPNLEGQEVFPSVEVIDRLYPPAGQKLRFPIPVEISREEVELALSGRFVTRVLYLEEPRNALPVRDVPGTQLSFDVSGDSDPLLVADELGRPMAVLRMGSRVPDVDQVTGRFLFGTPPFETYAKEVVGRGPATIRQATVPRIPLPNGLPVSGMRSDGGTFWR